MFDPFKEPLTPDELWEWIETVFDIQIDFGKPEFNMLKELYLDRNTGIGLEFIQMVGQQGIGKTTWCAILACLYHITRDLDVLYVAGRGALRVKDFNDLMNRVSQFMTAGVMSGSFNTKMMTSSIKVEAIDTLGGVALPTAYTLVLVDDADEVPNALQSPLLFNLQQFATAVFNTTSAPGPAWQLPTVVFTKTNIAWQPPRPHTNSSTLHMSPGWVVFPSMAPAPIPIPLPAPAPPTNTTNGPVCLDPLCLSPNLSHSGSGLTATCQRCGKTWTMQQYVMATVTPQNPFLGIPIAPLPPTQFVPPPIPPMSFIIEDLGVLVVEPKKGHCHKCGCQMCDALDGWYGAKDDPRKDQCSNCRR